MSIFDAPTRDFCEVRRQKTNTPLQALALQNDIQVLEAARVLSQRMLATKEDDLDLMNAVFQQILVREPDEDELRMLDAYYKDAIEKFIVEPESAKQLVAMGEYEQLEVEPSKTAALMLTAQVIYNLDETITKE